MIPALDIDIYFLELNRGYGSWEAWILKYVFYSSYLLFLGFYHHSQARRSHGLTDSRSMNSNGYQQTTYVPNLSNNLLCIKI